MFGFLSPAVRDRYFCRAYTRLCQSQKNTYGITLLPFHSYESTHLYLIACDACVVTLDGIPNRACCQFGTYAPPATPAMAETERFCSAFSILLGYIDLKDDADDGIALFQRVILLLFHRRFDQCMQYFSGLDPEFVNVIARIVGRQGGLEKQAASLTLDQFIAATGDGFAYLFSLFATAMGRCELKNTLESIGRHVGEAVCAFDVAHDYHEDLRSGGVNPLRSESEIPAALARAKTSLVAAARICHTQFGEKSLAAAHLLSVDETLVLAHPNRAVKLGGKLAEDVASPCAAKNAAFLSFPFKALADKPCGDAVCVSGLTALLGIMTCADRASRAVGLGRTVNFVDPQTGQPAAGQVECRHKLM